MFSKEDAEVSNMSQLKNIRTDKKSILKNSLHSSVYFFSLAFWDMTLASVSDLFTLATKPLSWDMRVAQDLVKQTELVESPSLKVFKTWRRKATDYLIQSWQQSCFKGEAGLDDLQKSLLIRTSLKMRHQDSTVVFPSQ